MYSIYINLCFSDIFRGNRNGILTRNSYSNSKLAWIMFKNRFVFLQSFVGILQNTRLISAQVLEGNIDLEEFWHVF